MVMASAMQKERDRCVRLCRQRAELWLRAIARNPPAGAFQEARGRANEAAYLADLLESGVDLCGDESGEEL
jgi:hypothetical protein